MTLKTYEKSVDVLIEAYRRKKLFHGVCSSCAIANILDGSSDWKFVIGTSANGDIHRPSGPAIKIERAIKLIEKKGLKIWEATEIETAFEMSIYQHPLGYSFLTGQEEQSIEEKKAAKKLGQYIGLCAVLDVMSKMIEEEPKSRQDELDTIAKNFGVKLEDAIC